MEKEDRLMRIRTIWFSFGVAALLLATGCNDVEERMSWSPDGTRAVMRVGDGLCLVDTNGNISAPLVSNVESAAWLPDSRGLVLLRELTVTNWPDAARLLPPEEIATVESLAKGLPDLLKATLAAADGDSSVIEGKFFRPLKMEFSEFLSPTILCLFDTQPAALRQVIQGCKNPAKLEADLTGLSTTKVAEVSVLLVAGNQASGPPRAIERTLTGLHQPRPSPSAPVVAFLRGDTLMVAPLDGGTNRVSVAEKVEGNYDWTPDGKSLVYAVRLAEKWDSGTINLARIERRTVIDAAGALVAGKALPLALTASTFGPRVRCLPDGRVLFAGFQQQLPAPPLAAREARFFLIDPSHDTNAVAVTVPSAPGALPQDLAAFAPSPDGRQIAIVESGSDAVAVLDVATGALEVVSPKRGWESRALPAWRGTDELYFGALPETSSTRPELLRWRKGSTPQVFSRSWSDEAVSNLLEKPKK
jgi:hypothetical protein